MKINNRKVFIVPVLIHTNMVKNDTILTVGMLVLAGYVVYQLTQPTKKAVESALVPTGTAIGSLATSTATQGTNLLNFPKWIFDESYSIGENLGSTIRGWFS